jgi:hypothetical protein
LPGLVIVATFRNALKFLVTLLKEVVQDSDWGVPFPNLERGHSSGLNSYFGPAFLHALENEPYYAKPSPDRQTHPEFDWRGPFMEDKSI